MKYAIRALPAPLESDRLHDGYAVIAYSESFGCWFDLSERYSRYDDALKVLAKLKEAKARKDASRRAGS